MTSGETEEKKRKERKEKCQKKFDYFFEPGMSKEGSSRAKEGKKLLIAASCSLFFCFFSSLYVKALTTHEMLGLPRYVCVAIGSDAALVPEPFLYIYFSSFHEFHHS